MRYGPFQRCRSSLPACICFIWDFVFVGCQISSSSQRYVSFPECSKTSDYINVLEEASSGRVDFKNKTTRIDYVNVKESQRKKVSGKGQARCAEATSISSDASEESAVNYSKVVFTRAEK